MAMKMNGVVSRTDLYHISPDAITVAEGFNPRLSFGDAEDESLKESIREHGVITPIRVRKGKDGSLTLIDGERRLRAVRELVAEGAAIRSVPTIVETKTNEAQDLITALISNEGKRLNPVEEARAYARLVSYGMTPEQVGKAVGRSKPHIYERLALDKATPEVKEAVARGDIGVKAAVSIVKEGDGTIVDATVRLEQAKEEAERAKADKAAKRKATMEAKAASVPPVETPSAPLAVPADTPKAAKDESTKDESPKKVPAEEAAPAASAGFEVVKRQYTDPALKVQAWTPALSEEEARDLYAEAVMFYKECPEDDTRCRQFYAGQIRAFAMLFGEDDPVELDM